MPMVMPVLVVGTTQPVKTKMDFAIAAHISYINNNKKEVVLERILFPNSFFYFKDTLSSFLVGIR